MLITVTSSDSFLLILGYKYFMSIDIYHYLYNPYNYVTDS